MGRQDCAVLARAAQNLAAALSSRQQLPSTGSTGGTLRSSSTKKVCATGAGSASPVVSMRMASNRCLRFSSLCRMRMRSPRTAPTGPARASSTELGHQGATGGVPPWAAQVPACPGARRWLPPTRAADAAVVHLEDLLLGLDHQAVVHADLCGERERAGGGGEARGSGILVSRWRARCTQAAIVLMDFFSLCIHSILDFHLPELVLRLFIHQGGRG